MEAERAVLSREVLATLEASVGGDRSFVAELIEAYLAEGETHVAEIEAAAAANSATKLVRPAHTLKSSSATLGAMVVSGLSAALEQGARNGSVPAAEDIAAVRRAWIAAAAALRAWMGEVGS